MEIEDKITKINEWNKNNKRLFGDRVRSLADFYLDQVSKKLEHVVKKVERKSDEISLTFKESIEFFEYGEYSIRREQLIGLGIRSIYPLLGIPPRDGYSFGDWDQIESYEYPNPSYVKGIYFSTGWWDSDIYCFEFLLADLGIEIDEAKVNKRMRERAEARDKNRNAVRKRKLKKQIKTKILTRSNTRVMRDSLLEIVNQHIIGDIFKEDGKGMEIAFKMCAYSNNKEGTIDQLKALENICNTLKIDVSKELNKRMGLYEKRDAGWERGSVAYQDRAVKKYLLLNYDTEENRILYLVDKEDSIRDMAQEMSKK